MQRRDNHKQRCFIMQDAADRGRLGASTFKRLNLGLAATEFAYSLAFAGERLISVLLIEHCHIISFHSACTLSTVSVSSNSNLCHLMHRCPVRWRRSHRPIFAWLWQPCGFFSNCGVLLAQGADQEVRDFLIRLLVVSLVADRDIETSWCWHLLKLSLQLQSKNQRFSCREYSR